MQPLETGMLAHQRKSKLSAFTLLEVMIVIVIMAIIVTVAVVTFSGFNQKRKFSTSATDVKALVTTLQNQAILTPAIYGLRLSSHGYQVYRYNINTIKNTGVWQQITKGPLVNTINIPEETTLKLVSVNGKKSTNTAKGKPQIIFSPSSEMTAFVVNIYYRGLKGHYVLIGISNGVLTLKDTHGKVVTLEDKHALQK